MLFLSLLQRQAFDFLPVAEDRTLATVVHLVGGHIAERLPVLHRAVIALNRALGSLGGPSPCVHELALQE